MSTFHAPAPWESLQQRRGDPLGFRYAAREIADAWAPGISGRQRDARWLTLLCKALSTMNCNGKTNRDCYALMSKFERGILVAASNDGEGRHLPGKRVAANTWPERYRYYGPWGTYKPLLISCGLVVKGNPWELTTQGKKLAALINVSLTLDGRTSAVAGGTIDGLRDFKDWFPPKVSFQPLERDEIKILCPLLFGIKEPDGITRTNTVNNLAQHSFQTFCSEQPLNPFVCWFDEFTRGCLGVLNQALASQPTRGLPITIPTTMPPGCSLSSPQSERLWSGPQQLLANLVATANAPQNKAQVILDWHIEHSVKPFFQANGRGGYIRIADRNATMMTGYSYRLWNLWCLAQQICPSKFKKIPWPAWLDQSTQADDEESGDE